MVSRNETHRTFIPLSAGPATTPVVWLALNQAQTFDAGSLVSLIVKFFCIGRRTTPVNWYNNEHAIRGQVNGSGFERRAKRHALKRVLAGNSVWSDTRNNSSLLGSAHGFGQHGCRSDGGGAFFWMLRRGQVSWEDSPVARRVSVSLAKLRPVPRTAGPKSSARPARHARATPDGFAQPDGPADFRDPTRFRKASAAARDRFLSFAVRSQV